MSKRSHLHNAIPVLVLTAEVRWHEDGDAFCCYGTCSDLGKGGKVEHRVSAHTLGNSAKEAMESWLAAIQTERQYEILF